MSEPMVPVFTGTNTISNDVSCTQCGYNLRGLKPDGRCPECGADVAATYHFYTHRTPSQWVIRFHRLVWVAIGCYLFQRLASSLTLVSMSAASSVASIAWTVNFALLVALLLLPHREAPELPPARGLPWRSILRITAVLSICHATLAFSLPLLGSMGSYMRTVSWLSLVHPVTYVVAVMYIAQVATRLHELTWASRIRLTLVAVPIAHLILLGYLLVRIPMMGGGGPIGISIYLLMAAVLGADVLLCTIIVRGTMRLRNSHARTRRLLLGIAGSAG